MAELGLKGGDKMLTVIRQLVNSLGPGQVVQVGFMEGAMAGYNGPRPLHGRKETLRRANAEGHQVPAAQAAFWAEYGTVTAPPRPFFRTMIERQSPTWGRLAKAALKMSGNNATVALQIMGLKIGEQLQESIINFKDPGNAQSVIDRKGFDDPLIDSHNMLRAVEFSVQGTGERFVVNGGA